MSHKVPEHPPQPPLPRPPGIEDFHGFYRATGRTLGPLAPSPAISSCLWSRFTLECWTSHFKEKFIEVLSNCISNNLFKVSSDFYSGVSCSTWCGLVYLVGQVTGGVKRWPTINKVEMLQLRQPLVPPPCLPVINLAI